MPATTTYWPNSALPATPEDSQALAITVTDVNEAPTLSLTNVTTTFPEDTDTTSRVKVADITITDDALGTNVLSLSGTDSGLFEIDAGALYLKAGSALDFETNPILDVTVVLDDAALPATPEDSQAHVAVAGHTDLECPVSVVAQEIHETRFAAVESSRLEIQWK